jgi:hypothetical protein
MDNKVQEQYESDMTIYLELIERIENMQKDPMGRFDQRKLALAKTNFEQGMLWLSAATGVHPRFTADD